MCLFPSIRKRLTTKGDIRTILWAAGGLAAIPILTVLVANMFLSKTAPSPGTCWDMIFWRSTTAAIAP